MKKVFSRFVSLLLVMTVLLSTMATLGMMPVASAATTLYWPVCRAQSDWPGHTYDGHGLAKDIWGAGKTVIAAAGGVVVLIRTCSHNTYNNSIKFPSCCYGMGTGLIIKGNDGYCYQYAHMRAGSIPSDIKLNSTVKAGQKIGIVGNTGNSSGDHLHFEISTNFSIGNPFTSMQNSQVNPVSETLFKYLFVNDPVTSQTACKAPVLKQEKVEGGIEIYFDNPADGSKIYYSTDGTNPTTAYNNNRIMLTATTTVKAVAKKSGFSDTAMNNTQVTVNKTKPPVITPVMKSEGCYIYIKPAEGEEDAKIYTTTGSTPETCLDPEIGVFPYHEGYITESKTVKAIAVKSGCAASDTTSANVDVSKPVAPSIELLNSTGNKIPVGKSANVKWTKIDNAYQYTATLYKDDRVVSTYATTGTAAAFELNNVGKYTIAVKAKNFVGSSDESIPPVEVEAMAPCTVSFMDGDSVLETQEVEYGGSAKRPTNPSKKGYSFDDWTGDFTNITEDRTINARFIINKYTVKFYGADGTTLLSTQEIEYQKSANAPVAPAAATGYSFAAWTATTFDEGYDYTCVDGNMSFIPTYVWTDESLDVAATIQSAVRDDTGESYTVTVNLSERPNKAANTKVIVYLVTSEDKLVKSAFQEVRLAADEEKTITVTINTNLKASKAKVAVVGYDSDYETTGGAQSVLAEAPITAVKEWSDWSEWSTVYPEGHDDVEPMIQYASREKQTTTSTSPTMEGWIQSDSWIENGEWGNWSGWSTTRQSTNANKEEKTEKQFKYYYFNCQNCGFRSPYWNCSCPNCGATIGCNWHEQWSSKPYSSVNKYQYNSVKSYTTSIDGNRWYWSSGNTWATAVGTIDSTGSDPVIRQAYRYRTRTSTTYYSYWKWSDFSAWQIEPILATDTIEIKTQTVYRYRDEVELSDPTAGAEDNSGTRYEMSGIAAVDTSLSGKRATVMVYNGKNSDPTNAQLQYVGQITIGENNAWAVSFIPKNPITELTGDYFVTLGIEGMTTLITVDTIEAPKPIYTVTFQYEDGTVIDTQSVEEGAEAQMPIAPEKAGYTFIGWSVYTKNIQSNTTATAVYVANTYMIAFVNWANQDVSLSSYKYGDTIELPQAPDVEGMKFVEWDIESETVTDNAIIEAVYEKEEYTVKFLDQNGGVFATQQVKYGEAAILPTNYVADDGYEFISWSNNVAWWNVTEALEVEPLVVFDKTVENPTVSVLPSAMLDNGEYVAQVELQIETETEEATLYYTTDGTEPTVEDVEVEDGGIVTIETTEVLKVKAIAPMMNSSETIDYSVNVIQYDEFITTLPTIKAITTGEYYQVGKTNAKVCMRVDNPKNREVTEFGLTFASANDGNVIIESSWDDFEAITDLAFAKAIPIKDLEAGKSYTYQFYIIADGMSFVSDSYEITTLPNDEVSSLSIKNNSGTKTINFGDELKLSAVKTNVPAGAEIVWYINGEEKGRGIEYTAPAGTADYTVTVKLIDSNGNVIEDANGDEIFDEEHVTVKAGFFQKLIAFFKNLFGASRIITQAFKEF